MSIKPTFSGEVQLAGWSESHSGGCKVVFWLADSSDLDAFRAMTVRKGNTAGQRLACVLVEIGDNEQPVEPPAQKPAEPEPRASKPIARWLALRCKERDFQRWVVMHAGLMEDASEAVAADWCRGVCLVESRGDIDGNTRAEELFQSRIRGPWSKHCIALGYPQGE